MLKKSMGIFLSGIMLLTGCSQNINHAETNVTQTLIANSQTAAVVDATSTLTNAFNLVWKDSRDYSNEAVPFTQTQYTAVVPQYSVDATLSNVVNSSKFKGLSEEQIQKLVNNGFVVLNPNADKAYYYMKMYDIYEENEYKNIPNFITVDVALHIYHKFFDETLKTIEKEQLYTDLQQLTKSMLEKTKTLYLQTSDEAIKKDLADIMVYFSVANKLANDTYGDIPQQMFAIAEKEINLIEQSQGYVESPLFGFDVNYEQFIVRGHYTADEALQKYFKTMMWYGLIGYPFEKNSGELDYAFIEKAMMITYLAFLESSNSNDIALWDKIYAPTNFFVGQSDDITIFNMKNLMIEVYGDQVTLQTIKNEKYRNKLAQAVNKLEPPQINYKLVTGKVDTPTKKQFRFMGQRYTLDGNIMQELMFPIIRYKPTGLDVAAAFGNQRAEAIAKKDYLMKLDEKTYSNTLNKLKDKVDSLEQKDWQNNMYNGWLWTLKALWTKKDDVSGLPLFMKTQAWEDKSISTGLGSYAELKHDTVLYAKQPCAEKGGGEELQEYCPNYVEPAVEVYDRLLWLVSYSKVNLEKRGLLSDKNKAALEGMQELYELLRTCSVKELENTPLTEEENRALKYIGGKIEYIDDDLSSENNQAISSALVSDVAGIADVGQFLEIGTGLPNDILVATYNNGKVYLARGAVYSYYEFVSDKPLTDEQWHQELGIEKVKDGEWEYEKINPELVQKNTPKQPGWIESFKSLEQNNVDIPNIEYNVQ